ncbi:signal peptidase I [Vulcanibacillus modesticaldus]|uniref:Signal peptidase I n=2 Tax=Vulcanibacillus modesticaldus TaxID=337097 RepID=A0A1D2YXI4_9BACI|nr:signal peptidase I [Vulcanibacillus modesticaldus]
MVFRMLRNIYEWLKSLVIAALLAYIIHTFLFAIVIVSGPSMEPTLHNGERLILNKIVYKIHPPERGDIIVFHATETDDYIKRVIGIPGDKIEFKNNQLFVNGQPVEEPYLGDVYTGDISPFTVPDETLYVLGDNRNNSSDSRIFGPVAIDKVVGRVKIVIWPLNKLGFID